MILPFGYFTVNALLADFPLPSCAVALIVTLPPARNVTVPSDVTVATAGLLDVQVRLRLSAVAGATVMGIVTVAPANCVAGTAVNFTLVTFCGNVVMVHVANLPFTLNAVTVQVPV